MTAAEELAALRQRLAVYVAELRTRAGTGFTAANSWLGPIADDIERRFLQPVEVAEPVYAYGEREE